MFEESVEFTSKKVDEFEESLAKTKQELKHNTVKNAEVCG
jgi:prefoldin subunit 5